MSTRAALYLRISLDRTGDELGVTRQRAACRKIAKDRGWSVAQEYMDNSKSAYSKNVRRPAYDAMVKDYAAGKFDAVICWDLDRLTRQPRQLEDWIDAAEGRGLAVVTVDGGVDLGTETGRQFARIKAAIARGEVEHQSKRRRAANDQKAEQGKPFAGGRRPFGYQQGGAVIDEAEAAHFRWAAEQVIAGMPLRAIVRALNARGARTTPGGPWRPTELRRLLCNPRHAALRVHRGEVVGPGSWPAIIDEDTHRAVVAVLSDPARQPKGRPRVYLLSGVARCGGCGGKVYGRREARGTLYACPQGNDLGRRTGPVDEFVTAVIVARLGRPDAAELFTPADHAPRLAELRAEETMMTARLDALAEAFAAGDIDRRQLVAGTKRLRTRLDQIRGELPGLVSTPALAPLMGAQDVAVAWEELSTDAQREVIATLVQVTVHPPGRGARVFDPATVTIEWKGQS